MTCPCPHSPHRSLDKRPCEPCAHCNAPAGIWCAPRCPRKPDRVGEPVEEAGPERWPAEWFQARESKLVQVELTLRTEDGVELGELSGFVDAPPMLRELTYGIAPAEVEDLPGAGEPERLRRLLFGIDPAEPGGDRTVAALVETGEDGQLVVACEEADEVGREVEAYLDALMPRAEEFGRGRIMWFQSAAPVRISDADEADGGDDL